MEGFAGAEGVDVSSEQIELGRSLGIRNLYVGSLEDHLRDRLNAYGVIFMRDVLEHIPKNDVCSVLDLCARSLQPGGVLVVQVPNADSPFFGRIRYGDFTHQAAYNKSSLSQLFLLAGLEPFDFRPAIVLPLTIRTVRKWLSWKFFSIMYRAGLSAELGPGDYIVSMNIVAASRKTV
jgi:2-polyprenyl-3-methyl-5-hydroxy-6-metoxy-1,4-benzoquinol methylase